MSVKSLGYSANPASIAGVTLDTVSLNATKADIILATFPTVAKFYATMAAALAAINTTTAASFCAIYEDFGQKGPDRTKRFAGSMAINGSNGQTMEEKWYLVTPSYLDETKGFLLEQIGDLIIWTTAATAFPASIGARASHCLASAVAYTATTDVLTSRTRFAPAVVSREMATMEIYDIGEASGILRVVRKGTATGGHPLQHKWN